MCYKEMALTQTQMAVLFFVAQGIFRTKRDISIKDRRRQHFAKGASDMAVKWLFEDIAGPRLQTPQS